MPAKLTVVSLVTLGLLSGFVAAIIFAAMFLGGIISAPLLVIFVIGFNFLVWLIGPYINTLIYQWMYKAKFYDLKDLPNKELAEFIRKNFEDAGKKPPKIGIIPDQNPTAFTFGSAAFNARLVLTEGIFKYLNKKEVEAVVAHEIGHIVHNDFIIMTIASTLLQILYTLFIILTRTRSAGTGWKSGEKKGNYLVFVGFASYLLYIIGTYILLFLSRTREYYADEYSAKVTKNPDLLSSALIKIAYGIAITPDTGKTANLLNSTRTMGLFDIKYAKDVGLVYQNSSGKMDKIKDAMAFDFINPWATIQEISSTHPLIGKRIRSLSKIEGASAFKFDGSYLQKFDKKKIWSNFRKDLLIQYLPFLFGISTILTIVLGFFVTPGYFAVAGISFIGLIIAPIIKVKYRYPSIETAKSTDVLTLMSNVYASPVKGQPVKLEGKAIGRGQAGYVFSEDLMFQDKEGLIYLNYESILPIFGNFLFAWKKVEKLLGKPANVSGWFIRGATHHVELYTFQSATDKIKSYVYMWAMIAAVLPAFILGVLIVIGAIILL